MQCNEPRSAGRSADKARRDASSLLGDAGPFVQALHGFTVRTEQQAMAALIEQALGEHTTVLCEAGTGTGKTLAYLVPCLESGRKTIISTATKTLQDQLFERDIPLVQAALGVTISVALLKGRANYLCLHRLDAAHGARDLGPSEQAHLAYLSDWARHSERGDIATAAALPDDALIWPSVTSTVDNCLGQACQFFDDCFVVKARREAANADVVVVNHHLLFADMVLREEGFAELLPSADTIVLDEAHQIPDVASTFFGSSLSSHQLRELCGDSVTARDDEAPDMPGIRDRAEVLEAAVTTLVRALGRYGPRGDWAELVAQHSIDQEYEGVVTALHRLRDELELASERGPKLENCYERSLQVAARLQLFLVEERDSEADMEWIRWFECSARGATLHATPVSIVDPFQGMVGSYAAAWIFTSATLAVNGDFSHFKHQLGIENADEGCWDSPFNYADQTLMYLPGLQFEPRDRAYLEAVVEMSVALVAATRGRTFMLFTSYKALDASAELLRGRVDYPLLVQGHAPRAELLKQFEELGNAVLLGTATFWQGIDVRGSALSCVIIDKLPFAPPDDPVTRARIAALRMRGANPFFDYQVPAAVIALKQGVGRLIRDYSDCGVLVLCDPRLETRAYGSLFLNSLPPMARTSDLNEVVAFLERL
ncbi:MAG: ATP-dependent DNA helicase [Proteobacteria bacterium]|nr:MAG: ATP-dependent DNA helicase [Pseudomonadota bacterium]